MISTRQVNTLLYMTQTSNEMHVWHNNNSGKFPLLFLLDDETETKIINGPNT